MPVVEFFERKNGRIPTREFITEDVKDKEIQNLIDSKLERLRIHGQKLDGDYFEHIDGDLWEFRIKTHRGYVRIFYVLDDLKFVMFNGVLKKSKRAQKDIIQAQGLMEEYFEWKRLKK